MVDASRQGDQVPLVHCNADPFVLLVPDVKVGLAVQDVANLIIQVQVLLKEHLQLPHTNRQRGLNNAAVYTELHSEDSSCPIVDTLFTSDRTAVIRLIR